MRMSSVVMTGIEGEEDIEAKDKESGGIWCEALEFKTHLECGIPKELWGNWPIEKKMNITWGCKERNLWNCSVRVLKSVKEPNETIVVVLWYGSLLSWNGLWALDCD
jgi:hypothetical protein